MASPTSPTAIIPSTVYRTADLHDLVRRRWPIVLIVVWFAFLALATRAGSLVPAIYLLASLYALTELREATYVLPNGIRIVPAIGRAHTYPWAEIGAFAVDASIATSRYSAHVWYGVRAHLTSGKWVWLHGIHGEEGRAEAAENELNGELQRHNPALTPGPSVGPYLSTHQREVEFVQSGQYFWWWTKYLHLAPRFGLVGGPFMILFGALLLATVLGGSVSNDSPVGLVGLAVEAVLALVFGAVWLRRGVHYVMGRHP